MLSSDIGCAWPARMFARVTRGPCSESCWHHDRLRLPVSVWLLHHIVGRGRAGGGRGGQKNRWSKKRQRKRRVRLK